MSTYYFLVCDVCRVRCPFIRLGGPGQASFLYPAETVLPEFVMAHVDLGHQGSLRVIQEAEPEADRYESYTEGQVTS